MKTLLKILFALLLAVVVVGYALLAWPLRDRHPALRLPHGAIAVRGATIYLSPDAPPLQNATLVARDGRIIAVGSGVAPPADAQLLPCDHCVITAGFWNTHIHFTQSKWLGSAWQRSPKLNAQLADMLTSRGFTTVVDTGSDLRETVSLRRRIETGGLDGPFIYTAGSAIYPENGTPYYLRDTLPRYILKLLPEPATPAEAARDVQRGIAQGADILKLFTGSYVERGHVKPMRKEIARAAVAVAHQHHQLAFAHESNLEGVTVALTSGVDVLAHAPDTTDGIDDALISTMAQRMSMIPTLKMFATTVTTKPSYLDPIDNVVRRFHAAGGTLLFGTDVGYMTDYSTGDEFRALTRCGLTPMDILRMLTTAPASRFGVSSDKGTLEPGKLADFVLLAGDPAADVNAFTEVQATVRSGKVLWRAAQQ